MKKQTIRIPGCEPITLKRSDGNSASGALGSSTKHHGYLTDAADKVERGKKRRRKRGPAGPSVEDLQFEEDVDFLIRARNHIQFVQQQRGARLNRVSDGERVQPPEQAPELEAFARRDSTPPPAAAPPTGGIGQFLPPQLRGGN